MSRGPAPLPERAAGEELPAWISGRAVAPGRPVGLAANSPGRLPCGTTTGSTGATGLARLLFPRTLAPVTDPMSGFFVVRTLAIDPAALRPRGFKILLEVLVRTPRLRVAEVPFEFAERHAGKSKASAREMARYLRQLVALRITTAGRLRLARSSQRLKIAG